MSNCGCRLRSEARRSVAHRRDRRPGRLHDLVSIAPSVPCRMARCDHHHRCFDHGVGRERSIEAVGGSGPPALAAAPSQKPDSTIPVAARRTQASAHNPCRPPRHLCGRTGRPELRRHSGRAGWAAAAPGCIRNWGWSVTRNAQLSPELADSGQAIPALSRAKRTPEGVNLSRFRCFREGPEPLSLASPGSGTAGGS